MMLLAKRKSDPSMAKEAVGKLEVALTTVQGGGDKSKAAYYGTRLPEARALAAALSKGK